MASGMMRHQDRFKSLRILDFPRVVPLTCHGHSRPITHLSFSSVVDGDQYYLISACKGTNDFKPITCYRLT